MNHEPKNAARRLLADDYESCGDFEQAHINRSNDESDVIREYLRLTDPTPVDEAWLRSMFKVVDTAIGPFFCKQFANHLTFIVALTDGGWLAELKFTRMMRDNQRHTTFVPLREVTTRGQLRMLCAALGIELEEKV